ncbi:MAG: CAP domain-containing protein [Planctomycetia bacterium]
MNFPPRKTATLLSLCALSFCEPSRAVAALRPQACTNATTAIAAPDEKGRELSELLARLANPRLTALERERLITEILKCGESGARALSKLATRELERSHKALDSAQERYLAGFEKAAVKLIAARQTREALAEIKEQRAIVWKLQGDAELSKQAIHDQADPAVLAIRVVLEVDAQAVREHGVPCAKAHAEWEQELAGALEWQELQQRALAALPALPGSAFEPRIDAGAREQLVRAEENWLCTLAMPMSAGDRRVLLENRAMESAPDLKLDPEVGLGVLDLNRLRILLGSNALRIDPKLCVASQGHSEDMQRLGFFAHESPVEGKRTPGDRAAKAGTSGGAENIARGQRTAKSANQAWWYSPGHHKNMLGGHARIGLGRKDDFWTQMFG